MVDIIKIVSVDIPPDLGYTRDLTKGIKVVEDTSCFTYKVEMIVQILAEDEVKASEQLEKNGGYVTSRKVTLMDSVPLFNGASEA
jgi:hypothetical protein